MIFVDTKAIGSWDGHKIPNCDSSYQYLQFGQRYRIVKEFVDYDRLLHVVSEEWSFIGYSFLPYDDGASFFVSLDGEQKWQMRLQWRAEEQQQILDNLVEYIGVL